MRELGDEGNAVDLKLQALSLEVSVMRSASDFIDSRIVVMREEEQTIGVLLFVIFTERVVDVIRGNCAVQLIWLAFFDVKVRRAEICVESEADVNRLDKRLFEVLEVDIVLDDFTNSCDSALGDVLSDVISASFEEPSSFESESRRLTGIRTFVGDMELLMAESELLGLEARDQNLFGTLRRHAVFVVLNLGRLFVRIDKQLGMSLDGIHSEEPIVFALGNLKHVGYDLADLKLLD